MKPTLVLFDFDGTITKKDTLFLFIRFIRGDFFFKCGMLALAPVIVLHLVGLLSNWRAKEIVLRFFLAGIPIEKFRQSAEKFAGSILPRVIRPAAHKKILDHLSDGHRVIIVTASAEDWVKPWCRQMGIECIATQLVVENGKITGKIKGRNCHGPEKVSRIKASLDIGMFDDIYAYGDSKGDLPMLQLATFAFYKHF